MPSRFTRLTARTLTYLSIAELIAALYVVTAGLALYHAKLMFEAVLPTFIAGVAVAYATSSLKGGSRAARALEYLTSALAFAVAAAGLAASLGGPTAPLGASLIIFGASLASLSVYALRRWDVRLSAAMLGYTQALAGLVIIGASVRDLFQMALIFMVIEAVGAIFAVTLHTFPSTFGDTSSKALIKTKGKPRPLGRGHPTMWARFINLGFMLHLVPHRCHPLVNLLKMGSGG